MCLPEALKGAPSQTQEPRARCSVCGTVPQHCFHNNKVKPTLIPERKNLTPKPQVHCYSALGAYLLHHLKYYFALKFQLFYYNV